jgi:hypothetical protein
VHPPFRFWLNMMSMTGTPQIAMALSFALVISKPAAAGVPAPPPKHESDHRQHPLFGSANRSPTDAPHETPGELHDCTFCHASDPSSGTNQSIIESDRQACPHLDLHHILYGSVIPYPTAAPYSNPGELYDCLSCHEIDTSSGTNQFLIERDCRVCHNQDLHHMLYGGAIPYPTVTPYSISAEMYVCLSCHEIDTSSGRNQFLIERDCQACHHATGVKNVIVDIKPGSDPNHPINIGSKGVLPVAILGSWDYDVTEIDVSSLLLEGEVVPLRSSLQEGVDGYMDLMLKFSSEAVADALGDLQPSQLYEVWITGTVEDGTRLLGSDSVVAAPLSWRNRPKRR